MNEWMNKVNNGQITNKWPPKTIDLMSKWLNKQMTEWNNIKQTTR